MSLDPNHEPNEAAKTVDEALRRKWWKHLTPTERLAVMTLVEHGRGAAPDGGVVDADIIDETSDNYRSGHFHALHSVALLLGFSRERAAVMSPAEIGDALRTLRLRAERCESCPWSPGTACGGAEGVCEGNVIPLVGTRLDLPTVDGDEAVAS